MQLMIVKESDVARKSEVNNHVDRPVGAQIPVDIAVSVHEVAKDRVHFLCLPLAAGTSGSTSSTTTTVVPTSGSLAGNRLAVAIHRIVRTE